MVAANLDHDKDEPPFVLSIWLLQLLGLFAVSGLIATAFYLFPPDPITPQRACAERLLYQKLICSGAVSGRPVERDLTGFCKDYGSRNAQMCP